ncbi:hypothetical protein M405DRAFT_830155 [Rhizopogon salebrosus TDB-379]|nr:hypothetical protein M405DRAFT_830155 [Rhizopogon salebrosus TDB-379]
MQALSAYVHPETRLVIPHVNMEEIPSALHGHARPLSHNTLPTLFALPLAPCWTR